jgi:hypothetical protein
MHRKYYIFITTILELPAVSVDGTCLIYSGAWFWDLFVFSCSSLFRGRVKSTIELQSTARVLARFHFNKTIELVISSTF